jgi:2-polyprenyl-3-methyl-5-hydroxy-6-metoxy-1,4-benzoquinol methylase
MITAFNIVAIVLFFGFLVKSLSQKVETSEENGLNKQSIIDEITENDGDIISNLDRQVPSIFNPIEMKRYQLIFETMERKHISLSLLQSDSAFCSTGNDDTGLVLWGPSVALSQFLLLHADAAKNPNAHHYDTTINPVPLNIQGKTVMELGCGGAIPSLIVAGHLGPARVIATDFRTATLEHVQYHANTNKIKLPIETYQVDWEDGSSQDNLMQYTGQPDILLAADVIYGLALVSPLVQTIQRYLPRHMDARLILTTRDGREGVKEFQHLMTRSFDEIQSEKHHPGDSFLPPIPEALKDDIFSRERYFGNFTTHVYRWKDIELSKSSHLGTLKK